MKIFFLAVSVLAGFYAGAQLKIATVFSDHMVLQRDRTIPVWGWAKKGEKISIRFHQQEKQTVTDKAGKWMLYLDNESAGGPYSLLVKSASGSIELKDVLVGDVWICSGQSNMEWPLSATADAEAEIKKANYPQIRHIKVEHEISVVPLDSIKKTSWQVCTDTTAANFTAAGYYFAKTLQPEINIPIGLLNITWGGTIVESWTSKQGLTASPDFAPLVSQLPPTKEQFERDQSARIRNSIAAFQYTDTTETSAGWESASYDDSRWSKLLVPKNWEEQGLNALDGTIWYRKTIHLTKEQISKDIVLWLGMIDDCDTTFVNGVKVAETCQWDKIRKYTVPSRVLNEGKNVIVVKVLDTGGGGGFHGDAADIRMVTAVDSFSLAGEWKARVDIKASVISTNPNAMPTLINNAMIHPLLPFAFKGVIWYQGESNAEWAEQYRTSFPMMIQDWRNNFKQGNFPFYFVQLTSFNANNQNGTDGSKWAELRESQSKALALPNTAMIVTTDIGDPKDLHPKNKKDIGRRLAALALKNDYGKDVVVAGPLYKSMTIEGNRIRIGFSNTGSGLQATGNKYGYLNGFMIAGKDQQFKWAKAVISNNEVIVWNDDITEPVAVRYAWTDDINEANLANKEGLPAAPFRTDNWKLTTSGIKYFIGK